MVWYSRVNLGVSAYALVYRDDVNIPVCLQLL